MSTTTAVSTEVQAAPVTHGMIEPFSCIKSFEDAQRMSACLAASTMVPTQFRGPEGRANCVVAFELASRLRMSPLLIMQNMYLIQGRPSFSTQFIITAISRCGRFGSLKYKMRRDANGRALGCTAYATELATGEVIEGPEITMEMAQAEGWSTKSGSKWKTMPEVMLRYRAAAFFGRLYAPDVLLGYTTTEELIDEPRPQPARAVLSKPVAAADVPAAEAEEVADTTEALNALADEPEAPAAAPTEGEQKTLIDEEARK